MKLYVSDLDGTLLTKEKTISEYSKSVLNGLLKDGLEFTVATARTPATAVEILEGININMPVILMNGVVTYDIENERYMDIKDMDKGIVDKILSEMKKHNRNGFIYGVKNSHLYVYYKDFAYRFEYDFYKERCNKPQKTFVQVDEYEGAIEESSIINFVIFGSFDEVKTIYDSVKKIEGITCSYYEDIYEEDAYFLEIYSIHASKAKAIKALAESRKENKIVCFGDNINDIPMFEMCDEGYAVENAVDQLKNIASGVIGSNNDDAVIRFIKKDFYDKK